MRDRLKTALPAYVIFTALGFLADNQFWASWWWYVGLGIALSAVFLEPFFSTARAGIANTAAAVGAYWSADRAELGALWLLFLAVCLVIFVAAVLATSLPGNNAAKGLLNRIGSFGRASYLGLAILLLECASKIAAGDAEYAYLAVASVLLIVGVSVRWSRIVAGASQAPGASTIIDAVAPALLLFEGRIGRAMGDGVQIRGSGDSVEGVVAGYLPGPLGTRTQVASVGSWQDHVIRFPQTARVGLTARSSIIGLASAGSTATSITFAPFSSVELGDCVRIDDPDGPTLVYQVLGARLVEASWAAGRSVSADVRAQQLGYDDGGFLRSVPRLPQPHAILRSGGLGGGSLPAGFRQIGRVAGTGFPIGFAIDSAQRAHIAVLGMSGMGKTTLVSRICSELGSIQQVVALDATGEYSTKLGVASWTRSDYSSKGFFVDQPSGALAAQAEQTIKGFMLQSNGEYVHGSRYERTICLEEAHGFIPEWNFATRPEADSSALSARYIMQARKFGLSFILVSQRTAVVSKSALSQCESYVVFRTVDDTSLSYIEGIVGSIARDVLPSLARHEALCFGPAFNSENPVVVRLDPPT